MAQLKTGTTIDGSVALTKANLNSNVALQNLKNLMLPSQNGGWRDIVRAGWKPCFFNQQWGGAPILGGLDGDLTMDYASGVMSPSSTTGYFGLVTTYSYRYQQIKVSHAITVAAVWIKIYKIGNPTGNMTLAIYSDNAGVPNAIISNGTATAIAGTLITSDTNAAWYRFEFATPPSLSANTAYHLVFGSSSNSDTNYYSIASNSNIKYPGGGYRYGSSVPVWEAQTDGYLLFMIEPTSTYRMLQSGGAFDYKIKGMEGNPLDQSYGLTASLKDLGFNPYETTWRGVFTDLAVSKPFAEFMYGLDHDRISLATDASGYVVLKVYENDGTVHTVTGTTAVSSGTFDIGFYVRAKGDGSDAITLYINGASNGTPETSQTITFDYIPFRELGTAWLMGGFPAAPTWTGTAAMTVLPSADTPAWTYLGTVTEAAHAVVSGGKLYQQIVGVGDTCYWTRTSLGFNNTNGWAAAIKLKILKASDAVDERECLFRIKDGTTYILFTIHSYYVEITNDGANYRRVQFDFTKQENTLFLCGKGADVFLFCNGALIYDGTGMMIYTSAGDNLIEFGDADSTSGSNAEAIWDYVKYYTTAAILPQFNSGSCSEVALWSGNMTSILPVLYNSGTRVSVKQYCGMSENYVKRIMQSMKQRGITDGPTTTSTSYVLIPDMEQFVLCERVMVDFFGSAYVNTAAIQFIMDIFFDGALEKLGGEQSYQSASAGANYYIGVQKGPIKLQPLFGLHKVEWKWYTSSQTLGSYAKRRFLSIQEVE